MSARQERNIVIGSLEDKLVWFEIASAALFALQDKIRIAVLVVMRYVKDVILAAATKVSVNDENFFVVGGKSKGEIGTNEAFAIARSWRSNKDYLRIITFARKEDISLDRFNSLGKG